MSNPVDGSPSENGFSNREARPSEYIASIDLDDALETYTKLLDNGDSLTQESLVKALKDERGIGSEEKIGFTANRVVRDGVIPGVVLSYEQAAIIGTTFGTYISGPESDAREYVTVQAVGATGEIRTLKVPVVVLNDIGPGKVNTVYITEKLDKDLSENEAYSLHIVGVETEVPSNLDDLFAKFRPRS